MKKINKQSGQVLIGVAFAMVVLAGFAGLAIDMGSLRNQKRLQQTAADAAAIAGASELNEFNGPLSAVPAGQAASSQNGFADASGSLSACTPTATVGTTCVLIKNPPDDVTFNGATIAGGKHKADAAYVEALIVKVQPTYFMKLLGWDSQIVLARAVATNTGGGGAGGGGCIYTLGLPTNKANVSGSAVVATGNVVLNAPTCGIVDNGNLDANGSVQVLAGSIGYGKGGLYNPPSQQSPCTPGVMPANGVCPTPVQMAGYSGNPFAGLYPTAPTLGAGSSTTSGGVTTYTPGSYTNISINGGNVVFSPGVYDISGNFTINGNANVCVGGTATFSGSTMTACAENAATGGSTFYMNGASSSFTSNGNAVIQMYAPDSGTYEALLFYQDPSTQVATFNGTSASFYQGAIYAPHAKVRMGGNAGFNSTASYTVIVSEEYEIFGGPVVNLASNYSGLTNGGGPLKGLTQWAVLVE